MVRRKEIPNRFFNFSELMLSTKNIYKISVDGQYKFKNEKYLFLFDKLINLSDWHPCHKCMVVWSLFL